MWGSAFAHWYCLPRHWCSVYFSLYFSVLLIYGSFHYYVSSLLISYSTVLKLLPVSPVEFFISEIVVLFSRSSMILFFYISFSFPLFILTFLLPSLIYEVFLLQLLKNFLSASVGFYRIPYETRDISIEFWLPSSLSCFFPQHLSFVIKVRSGFSTAVWFLSSSPRQCVLKPTHLLRHTLCILTSNVAFVALTSA